MSFSYKLIGTVLALILLTSCSAAPEQGISSPPQGTVSTPAPARNASDAETILTLSNKSFATMVNQIYSFPTVYIGRTIRFSGTFNYQTDTSGGTETQIPYVIQEAVDDGHGHGSPGFEIVCEDTYPPEGSWVEVTGTLEYVLHGGLQFLCVRVEKWEETEKPVTLFSNPHANMTSGTGSSQQSTAP